jgi:hypothetical protein
MPIPFQSFTLEAAQKKQPSLDARYVEDFWKPQIQARHNNKQKDEIRGPGDASTIRVPHLHTDGTMYLFRNLEDRAGALRRWLTDDLSRPRVQID